MSCHFVLRIYLTREIIGGGTAGLTVAERLAEDPTISVAVIEAGGFYELDNGNVSQIPAFYSKNFNQTAAPETIQPLIDWAYITEPQVVSSTNLHRGNVNRHRVWATVNSIILRAKRSAEGMEVSVKQVSANLCQFWPQFQYFYSVLNLV